jgi:DNA polymerase
MAKLKHLKLRTVDGVYSYTLKYFGAHTGRFSGDGGFNMQNIYRDARFGIMLRNVFIPRPGKKFLIVDYAQVEARILAWVVGLVETLELVRQGLSIYEVHAIQTMGWDVSKGSLKKVDPELYLLAKARVLALGYGCGAVKFQAMAKILCGLELDPLTCKRTVDDFRMKNPAIVRHWQELQRNMTAATRSKTRQFRHTLPSGRHLDYFDVNMSDGLRAKNERGGHSYKYYGGKLSENEIQAIGLDIIGDAIVACTDHAPEYPIVLQVHDELVFEVPEDISEKEIDRVCTLMTESSPWAEGLPLEVEWTLTNHYEK